MPGTIFQGFEKMSIKISAIICTHNRAIYLEKAVESLIDQSLPRDEYEIIVVDNVSSDNTKQVIEANNLQATGYKIKYIYEPTLGLSQSRNTGCEAAQGKYVAYLDDDAIADSRWLESILTIFGTIDPLPGCVGGKIKPIWEQERPKWLGDDLLGQLAVQDWGDTPFFIGKDEWLAGASIAYPKKILENIGGFPLQLGRKGKKLLSMEENYVREALEEKGYKYYYDPKIIVKHYIPQSRLNKKWFLKRAFWNGVSDALMQEERKKTGVLKKIEKGLGTLVRISLSLKDLRSIFSSNDKDIFRKKYSVYARVGHVFALWGFVQ